MAMTQAERQRLYRQRHPERAAKELETVRAKHGHKKGTKRDKKRDETARDVTPSPETVKRDHETVGQDRPESAALDPRSKLVALEATLEENLAYLRSLPKSPQIASRINDTARSLSAIQDKLSKLPPKPEMTLAEYMAKRTAEKAKLIPATVSSAPRLHGTSPPEPLSALEPFEDAPPETSERDVLGAQDDLSLSSSIYPHAPAPDPATADLYDF